MSSPPNVSDGVKSAPVFRTVRSIADGGMGSVELATYASGPRAGQLVAVKRPHPHLERDPRFGEWFFEEARITAGLSHPNVVEIYEWGTDARGRFLALEFVSGDSTLALLRDAKRHSRVIPIGIALYIVRKTAEGLHAAHELRGADNTPRGLVHRDVSPSNILLSTDGAIKLIDFGVAKVRDQLTQTTTGAIKGKLGYVSPEQARGERLDRRSDLFALGIVLWELLAGRRLFLADAHLELLRMVVSDPIPPIRSVRPDAPESVQSILDRALARQREDRFATAAEFSDAIGELTRLAGYTDGAAELAAFRASLPSATRGDERDTSSAAETRITQLERKSAARDSDATDGSIDPPTTPTTRRSSVARNAAIAGALLLAATAWIARPRSGSSTATPSETQAAPHSSTTASRPPVITPSPEPDPAPTPSPVEPAVAAPTVESTRSTTRRRVRAERSTALPATSTTVAESPPPVEHPAAAVPATAVDTRRDAPRTGNSAGRIFTPNWEAH